MSRKKRKNEQLRKRVRQAPLPSEYVRKPRGGDWSRMARAARRDLADAHRLAGL